MRRAATLGLVLAAGLAGGCADFDDWMEPEHSTEYRRGGYQRDDRSAPAAAKEPAGEGPGMYPDK